MQVLCHSLKAVLSNMLFELDLLKNLEMNFKKT